MKERWITAILSLREKERQNSKDSNKVGSFDEKIKEEILGSSST